MKWSIEQIKRLKHEGITIDQTIDVNDLQERDDEIRYISPAHVQGEADIFDDAVSFRLHVSCHMTLPCALTLEDVPYQMDYDTIETFLFSECEEEWEEARNEQVHRLESNTVELLPSIKDSILSKKPMRVVHPDAEPIKSGQDWELVDENQEKTDRIDPRMEKLAQFFDKKNR